MFSKTEENLGDCSHVTFSCMLFWEIKKANKLKKKQKSTNVLDGEGFLKTQVKAKRPIIMMIKSANVSESWSNVFWEHEAYQFSGCQ